MSGPNGLVQATVLFDSGSDRTYISSELMVRKGMNSQMDEFRVGELYAAFGGEPRNGFEITANVCLCLISGLLLGLYCKSLNQAHV